MDHEISLRLVELEDCFRIWEWANDPLTRQASFSSAFIPWQQHQKWFDQKLRDPNCIYYMITQGTIMLPSGTVRYDQDGRNTIVSINIAPLQRQKHIGSSAIELSTELVFRETSIQIIHACIKTNNSASIRAFTRAGYEYAGQTILHGNHAYDYTKGRDK